MVLSLLQFCSGFSTSQLNPTSSGTTISAEISHLELFPWTFSKTSNDSFDYRSDLCYRDCQVSMQLFKRTRISTWFFFLIHASALGRYNPTATLLTPQHPAHSNGKGRNKVSRGLADVWVTHLQGQCLTFLLVYNWSDNAFKHPNAPAAFEVPH